MAKRIKRIVVAGDVAVDCLLVLTDAADEGCNWQLHPAVRMHKVPGGAALLGEFIRRFAGDRARVVCPELPTPIG